MYDGVPTIVTTWLAIMPKISIFVLLLELQSGLGFTGASLSLLIDGVSFDVWKNLLLISSLLSDVYNRKLDVLYRGLSGYNTTWIFPVFEQVRFSVST